MKRNGQMCEFPMIPTSTEFIHREIWGQELSETQSYVSHFREASFPISEDPPRLRSPPSTAAGGEGARRAAAADGAAAVRGSEGEPRDRWRPRGRARRTSDPRGPPRKRERPPRRGRALPWGDRRVHENTGSERQRAHEDEQKRERTPRRSRDGREREKTA